MLFDPPGPRGKPQGMPHWPYVKAVDDALTTRGIPPGTVRASHHGLERGLTTYMTLAWDVSRASGRGGIRLDWEERQGWYYALTGLDSYDVLLYTVVTVLRTPMAAPETVADVAEVLVRHRRLPDRSSGRSGTAPGRYGLPPPTSAAPSSVWAPSAGPTMAPVQGRVCS
ncbi:DUF6292 family protein [Streptomyces canus]|uniref:DUF6292 family protein n=1 Tax=Streptomyces canus TaxID=58343 RepID=UPI0033AC630A